MGQTSSASDHTGLILGICIPIGLLIVVGIVSAIVYKQRKANRRKDGENYKDDYKDGS